MHAATDVGADPVASGAPAEEPARAVPVREQHIQAFLAELRQVQPDWDGRWVSWSAPMKARCVRALIQDHLDDHGHGQDWIQAGGRAAFVLAALFHERYPLTGTPLPQLNLQMGAFGEGFSIQMRRVTAPLLPPIPVPGGAALPPVGIHTNAAESMARAAAPMDALALPDEAIDHLVVQVGASLESEDRLALMMAAAFLVRWKGAQITQSVRGGVLFRDIHDPAHPDPHRGDVWQGFERLGDHADAAKRAVPDGGAFLLV